MVVFNPDLIPGRDLYLALHLNPNCLEGNTEALLGQIEVRPCRRCAQPNRYSRPTAVVKMISKTGVLENMLGGIDLSCVDAHTASSRTWDE